MNLIEFQQYVAEFSDKKGFNRNTVETRMLYLMTEIGELSKEILKVSFHPISPEIKEIKTNIGHEMFDVVWNVFDLATKLDIDLNEAFKQKMEINKHREWK